MPREQQRRQEPSEFSEKVIKISRVSKKTKGGNKMSFAALMVVGDRKGRVGVALGKAPDVLSAIKKGIRRAKKRMITIPVKYHTIPFAINTKHGAAQILLKPAPEGSGIIAGGAVRAVVEAAGITDIVGKILGSSNKANNVYATFKALDEIRTLVKVKKIELPKTDGVKTAEALKPSANKEVVKPQAPAKPQGKKPTIAKPNNKPAVKGKSTKKAK